MNSQFLQRSTGFFRTYALWVLPLLFISLFIRLLEYASAGSYSPASGNSTVCLYGLLNDAGFTLSIFSLVFPPLWLLWSWKPGLSFALFTVAGSLFLLTTALLSRYYLTTHTLLGADLFGYSFGDIRTTVGSSVSFRLTDLLPMLLPILFVVVVQRLRKRVSGLPMWASAILLCTGFCCTFWYNGLASGNGTGATQVSLSKGAYFVTSNLAVRSSFVPVRSIKEYPFFRQDNTADVLTPLFTKPAEKPNLVFLIVEGLGRDFTGPSASYGGFTPFLDSLSQQGLYWSNFLSSAGRSFAGLPSILGSLPFGKNGFNELGQKMPSHHSLVSLLKQNGYHANFFYGGNANFDKQDVFLEKQGIDFILDEGKFGAGYSRNKENSSSWGYPDGELYRKSLDVLAGMPAQPLLNIYFTLSSHEPFTIPNETLFKQKVADKLSRLPAASRERYAPYNEVWKAFSYSDESIRAFFAGYAKRADFANTIFVITGDHRLIPVPEQNLLSRFHVPLLIYSPLVKSPKTFTALSSHLDITPSLVKLLQQNGLQFPADIHWMGKGLDTANHFNEDYEMPFMRTKNGVQDMIKGSSFLSGNNLFSIGEGLRLTPDNNTLLRHELKKKLDSFEYVNQYVCDRNKLLKPGTIISPVKVQTDLPSPDEEKRMNTITGGLAVPDTLFARAQRLAFAGDYETARLLCRKVLIESPNFHDVRVLYGRTYAWEKRYNLAVPAFAEVVRRNPVYEDAYLAWIDTETWAGKKDSAQLLIQKALQLLPGNKAIIEKKSSLSGKK